MIMNAVRVSVIIPYSKSDVAEVTLEKLIYQSYPAEQTEIIVVGPNSSRLASRWPIKAVETKPTSHVMNAPPRLPRTKTGIAF